MAEFDCIHPTFRMDLVHRVLLINDSIYAVILRVLTEPNSNLKLLLRFLQHDSTTQWVMLHTNMFVSLYVPKLTCVANLIQTDFAKLADPLHFIRTQLMDTTQDNFDFFRRELNNQNQDHDDTQKLRCKLCRYILSDLPYRTCLICADKAHSICCQYPFQNYICHQCFPCTICFCLNPKDQIYKCLECGSRFHKDCGYQSTKYCSRCIKCEWCSKVITHSGFEGELLCENCSHIKLTKQYCLICKAVWTEDEEQKQYI